jgi:hypothetical protein
MDIRQVNIGLSNGQVVSYFVYGETNKKELFNQIKSQVNGEWFSFISEKDFCEYQINKNEIVSISIGLTETESSDYFNTVKELTEKNSEE